MIYKKAKIEGAYLIELTSIEDERGTFVRQFCKNEFKNIGIEFNICQCNFSTNKKRGTIRGMHYQKDPHPEKKIVSCTKGKIYDVILDLRKNSPTYLQWQGIEMRENDNCCIYIPPFVAHGFQTLEDNSTVFYQLGEFFYPQSYDGVRYDDPAFGIEWKDIVPAVISEKDQNFSLYRG